MDLKHRVKKIERSLIPPSEKAKLWVITGTYNRDQNDPKGRAEEESKIKAIKEGKTEHKDGGYYQKGDRFILIARIFTPINPNGPDEIEALKKRKAELKRKIKERENV